MPSERAIDEVNPSGKWEFGEDVSECFDDMLERSIPGYDEMRRYVFEVSSRLTSGRTVIDLGSSLGRAYERFADEGYSVVSCEVSKPMLEKQRELFGEYKNVDIRDCDIIEDFPNIKADIVTSVLTVQFTPIEERQRIIDNVYKILNDGGVFVLVEKVLGNTYDIDSALVSAYYGEKQKNRYGHDAIRRKRKSLSGVLVPVSSEFNKAFLRNAGFRQIDVFWRCLNFEGIVAVK